MTFLEHIKFSIGRFHHKTSGDTDIGRGDGARFWLLFYAWSLTTGICLHTVGCILDVMLEEIGKNVGNLNAAVEVGIV
jgi:hypothetical protein